uniref:Peptidase C1A papain C-terminal domain-containing protein n=1 Tax=Alexandrium monilatum TaxID=311494 RepID=A0A7S4TCG1_9DINO
MPSFLVQKVAVVVIAASQALASRSSSNIFGSYEDFRSRFGRAEQAGSPAGSFLEARRRGVAAADSVDWRVRVSASRHLVHDQGSCGSCWAVAAVGALEMYAELNGRATQPLSYEQLVDCVANPRSCGGNGGCGGATAELAFDYVTKHGLLEAAHYSGGYQSDGSNQYKCPDIGKMGSAAVRASGFQRLPVNKVAPLLHHVSSTGPAVVSVDASRWAHYGHGVFVDCDRNATVSHDTEKSMDYWLIRNSWSGDWGEEGHIRLQRHQADAGKEGFCGTDHDNQQGVGCKDDPKEVPVCGMCGVLSDSSYPTDVAVPRRHPV